MRRARDPYGTPTETGLCPGMALKPGWTIRDTLSVWISQCASSGELAVWQRSLCPTGIDEANLPFLGSHVGGGGVQDPAIHVAPKQYLLTMLGKQLVNLAHCAVCPSDHLHLGHRPLALSSWTLPGLLESI